MLKYTDLKSHQLEIINTIINKPKSYIWADMGAGKTASTLHAYNWLMDIGLVNKVLIISHPSIVNSVWYTEAKNWEELHNLRFNIIKGTAKQRTKQIEQGLSDFTLISIYNLKWFIDNNYFNNYDGLIIDEATLFKSYNSVRFKSIKPYINQFTYITLLSGTPKPNTYMDLWSPLFILDGGKRLGKNITTFRKSYMKQHTYIKHAWEMLKGSDKLIQDKVKDICINFKVDINLPQLFIKDIEINLDKKHLDFISNMLKHKVISDKHSKLDVLYKEYKKAELEEDISVIWDLEEKISNILEDSTILKHTSELYLKTLMISSGGYYDMIDNTRIYKHVHDTKVKYLKDMLDIYSNENFIIVYNYQFEKDMILEHINNVTAYDKKNSNNIIENWNKGNIKYLLTHVSSLSHGVNLQYGGSNMIYFSPTSNLEQYLQMNKRLLRNGQKNNVNIFQFYTTKWEKLVYDKLQDKNISQQELLSKMIANIIKE